MLDIFVPFLEAYSELTAEEQRIFDDFKAQYPILTYDDVEKEQGKFQIYQLPGGEKYHGVRFEGLDRLKAEGVQLNRDDYELVYEGLVGEFRGNATLEGIFTQFNTNQPADFSGHSLSVSDVIVISMDDKDTAYYCDSFGFTEMPEFFLEKERTQEKSVPSVADLAVGDIIMYDGARREIEEISPDRIKMKDLDAPDYGGILLGTGRIGPRVHAGRAGGCRGSRCAENELVHGGAHRVPVQSVRDYSAPAAGPRLRGRGDRLRRGCNADRDAARRSGGRAQSGARRSHGRTGLRRGHGDPIHGSACQVNTGLQGSQNSEKFL